MSSCALNGAVAGLAPCAGAGPCVHACMHACSALERVLAIHDGCISGLGSARRSAPCCVQQARGWLPRHWQACPCCMHAHVPVREMAVTHIFTCCTAGRQRAFFLCRPARWRWLELLCCSGLQLAAAQAYRRLSAASATYIHRYMPTYTCRGCCCTRANSRAFAAVRY